MPSLAIIGANAGTGFGVDPSLHLCRRPSREALVAARLLRRGISPPAPAEGGEARPAAPVGPLAYANPAEFGLDLDSDRCSNSI